MGIYQQGLKWAFFGLLLMFSMNGRGQSLQPDTSDYPYWIEMMQDNSVPVNDVVKAFDTYWNGREIRRGSGWKPFKRWEYYNTMRMRPDGSRATNAELLAAWEQMAPLRSQESTGGNWVILGPVQQPPIVNSGQPNGLGRINNLAFDPSDAAVIYAGAASGGLWKSVDSGQSWQPLTDVLPTLGVSSALVDPVNTEIVYLGTGDRDHNDAPGIGVMKSIDGGISWNSSNTGMGDLTVGDMLFHLTNSNIILAATNGGLYRSNNGGNSWQLKNTGNFKDIDQHPLNPAVFYATASGKFYRSNDTAHTWTQISTVPTVSRMMIATSVASPDVVYLLLANNNSFNSLHRSLDAGLSFTERSNSPNLMDWSTSGSGTGGQAWYDLAFTANPSNADELYAGGVNVWRSLDGGATWLINSHWTGSSGNPAVHADCHWLGYAPHGSLYAGNDGGVYYTNNSGLSWTEITSGLAISQIYKIGQSVTVRDRLMAGYQDNGTTVYNASGWLTVAGGDGMEAAVDPDNAAYTYGSYYYGDIYRLTNDNYDGSIAGNGTNGITEGGAWVTPFVISEADPNTMFIGMNAVWRSNNIKANSVGSVSWTQLNNGLSSGNCLDLELSPSDPDLLYVSKSNNTLYRTDDAFAAGFTFINLTGDLPHTGLVKSIETHPTNPNVVYIIQDRKIFRSEDRGQTWIDLTANLPDVPMSDLVYYKRSQEGLYLGTDIGVFYRDNYTNGWVSVSNGLPAAIQISEMDIWYDSVSGNSDRIRAASFGRGVWESGLYGTKPVAEFKSNKTLIPKGCTIDFFDLSSGIPDHWEWTFQGAVPSTSSAMNPNDVYYSAAGIYEVTLKVWNDAGSDSITKTSYIAVSDSLYPEIEFIVDSKYLCSSHPIANFSDMSLHCPDNWLWEFTPDSVTFLNGSNLNNPNPVVQFNAAGSYDLRLTVYNQNGSTSLDYFDFINVGGAVLPYAYDFDAMEIAVEGWSVHNPDMDNTWEIWDLGVMGKAAGIEIFGTNSLSNTDRLISPPFNLAQLNNASLQFTYAYAQYQAGYSDSLRLYVTDDCGQSWTRILSLGEDGSNNFATHPPTSSPFVPISAQDWCGAGANPSCLTVDLGAWTGKSDVRIAFESYSYLSNNIFIDEVRVNPFAGMEEFRSDEIIQLNAYPNPARDQITLQLPLSGNAIVRIYDLLGNLLREESTIITEDKSFTLSLKQLPKGIYLGSILMNERLYSTRIVRI